MKMRCSLMILFNQIIIEDQESVLLRLELSLEWQVAMIMEILDHNIKLKENLNLLMNLNILLVTVVVVLALKTKYQLLVLLDLVDMFQKQQLTLQQNRISLNGHFQRHQDQKLQWKSLISIKLTIQEAVLVINQVAKTDHQQSVHLAVQIVMAETNSANLLIKCEAESV